MGRIGKLFTGLLYNQIHWLNLRCRTEDSTHYQHTTQCRPHCTCSGFRHVDQSSLTVRWLRHLGPFCTISSPFQGWQFANNSWTTFAPASVVQNSSLTVRPTTCPWPVCSLPHGGFPPILSVSSCGFAAAALTGRFLLRDNLRSVPNFLGLSRGGPYTLGKFDQFDQFP